jgi:hypothetical protein
VADPERTSPQEALAGRDLLFRKQQVLGSNPSVGSSVSRVKSSTAVGDSLILGRPDPYADPRGYSSVGLSADCGPTWPAASYVWRHELVEGTVGSQASAWTRPAGQDAVRSAFRGHGLDPVVAGSKLGATHIGRPSSRASRAPRRATRGELFRTVACRSVGRSVQLSRPSAPKAKPVVLTVGTGSLRAAGVRADLTPLLHRRLVAGSLLTGCQRPDDASTMNSPARASRFRARRRPPRSWNLRSFPHLHLDRPRFADRGEPSSATERRDVGPVRIAIRCRSALPSDRLPLPRPDRRWAANLVEHVRAGRLGRGAGGPAKLSRPGRDRRPGLTA